MSALDDRLIDTYLDQLRRELQASPKEEQEILREVQSHLQLALRDQTQRDDGQVRLALEYFGPAQQIGRSLAGALPE